MQTGSEDILALQHTPAIYATGNTMVDGGFQGTLFQLSYMPDGLLTPLATPSFTLPGAAGGVYIAGSGIATDPSESFLYVAATGATGTVSQFAIGAGGALAPLSPPTVAVATGAQNIAISPDGKWLYVATGGTSIAQFARQANGTLAPQTPPAVTTAMAPNNIVTYAGASSTFAYALAQGALYQFTVNATGGLVPSSPATAVLVGQQCMGLTIDPIDALVIVACVADNSLRFYSIGANGTLTETSWSPYTTTGPNDVAFYAAQF